MKILPHEEALFVELCKCPAINQHLIDEINSPMRLYELVVIWAFQQRNHEDKSIRLASELLYLMSAGHYRESAEYVALCKGFVYEFVVNIRNTSYEVYIGRNMPGMAGSVWGNPFKDGPRDANISMFRELMLLRLHHGQGAEYEGIPRTKVQEYYAAFDLQKNPTRWKDELRKLKGKRLGCWCKPMPCHGDVLVSLIKELGL